jgi:hypothetical protein
MHCLCYKKINKGTGPKIFPKNKQKLWPQNRHHRRLRGRPRCRRARHREGEPPDKVPEALRGGGALRPRLARSLYIPGTDFTMLHFGRKVFG